MTSHFECFVWTVLLWSDGERFAKTQTFLNKVSADTQIVHQEIISNNCYDSDGEELEGGNWKYGKTALCANYLDRDDVA